MKGEDIIVLVLMSLGLLSKKEVSQPAVQQPTPAPTPTPQPQPQPLPCCSITPTPQPQPQPAPKTTPQPVQPIITKVQPSNYIPPGGYEIKMVKVYDKRNLNFGYIQFGHAVRTRWGQPFDEFDIIYINYHPPLGHIDVEGYSCNNMLTGPPDTLKAVKEQWPTYFPLWTKSPDYPKLIQDLETIYAFFDKYKDKCTFKQYGVNLTGYIQ